MKRVNEVFELPVDADLLVRDIAYGLTSREDESAIAHAINHVDALADALADLLDEIHNGGATRYTAEIAKQKLAAYRGEK
jgi:hypothetical protein